MLLNPLLGPAKTSTWSFGSSLSPPDGVVSSGESLSSPNSSMNSSSVVVGVVLEKISLNAKHQTCILSRQETSMIHSQDSQLCQHWLCSPSGSKYTFWSYKIVKNCNSWILCNFPSFWITTWSKVDNFRESKFFVTKSFHQSKIPVSFHENGDSDPSGPSGI